MNGNEPESPILAEWVLGRFMRYRTDAQNVELEAYAEEREVEAYSRDISGWGRPRPRLLDLLATAEFMLELIDMMLMRSLPNSPETEFLTTLRGQVKEIRQEIRAQIEGDPKPTATRSK